jgi:hypothetical protein
MLNFNAAMHNKTVVSDTSLNTPQFQFFRTDKNDETPARLQHLFDHMINHIGPAIGG